MELCEENRPSPTEPGRFGLAVFGPDGIPVLSTPARRLLGPLGWEGRALVAHLLTEFDDPWEHFYDSHRTENPHHLLPVGYRLREIAAAFSAQPPWERWECEDPIAWVDTWFAFRLVYFEPPLFLLTTLVRESWRGAVSGVGACEVPRDPITEAVMAGDDAAVFALATAGLDMDEAGLERSWNRDWDPATMDMDGERTHLEWGACFFPRLQRPPYRPLPPGSARLIGRCVVNRDWDDVNAWIETIDPDYRRQLRPLPAIRDELRRQLRGSGRSVFTRRRSPLHEDRWLDALIFTRLASAGVPEGMLELPGVGAGG